MKPTNTLGFLLHDASRLLRRRFQQRGEAHGLSSSQWRLLANVVRDGGGSAQARLAEVLEVEPISVSRLVDRMEQAGWVRRSPDPQDRRVRLVHPTEKALSAYAEVKAMAGGVFEEAMAGMDAEERRMLIEGLSRVVANLSELDGEGGYGRRAQVKDQNDEREE
ncbi:MarR family winged helix-turn-helix transcriptional regulator [Acidimangrovimonas sediminis]|uniref:MarR family winged helix-turn-helix transcriptional regulator n=1 Tax=Acidimangrovimonas sediminis TaxID=2056283 RepID=UPI000C8032E7|nr:MarR family transcriptional regulator [Acidimangrovimonas sediminis]